ncbi:NBR1-Ig-like domain-containing protein [Actinosynnema sp. NPDC049800]
MTVPSSRVVLGHQLRLVREAAGVRLADMAKQLGKSVGHLSNVEAGRDSASWDIVALYEERFRADGQLWTAYVEAQTSPRPPQRGAGAAPSYPIPGDESTFIADVTIPDGTVMPPKFIFEKVWRIKNTGSVPWVGRRLARDGAAGGYGVPHSPAYVTIPDTMPGEEVDISVPVRSQPLEGTSQARWKMVDGHGWKFFPSQYPFGLFMTIVVREGAPPPRLRRLA